MPYLGCEALWGPVFQQDWGNLLMTLLSTNVQRCVQILGCGIWAGTMLQSRFYCYMYMGNYSVLGQ